MTYRETFDEPADFWRAVAQAGVNGFDHADPRLEFSAATGLSGGIPSEGGFLVPDEIAAGLWEKVSSTGQLLGRTTRQPVSRASGVKIPAIAETSRADGSRLGGAQFYWADEAEEVTATRPKFAQLDLSLHKLFGLMYATDELLQDAPALAGWLERAFVREAVFVIESEIISGTGAGRPLGILNADATLSAAKESGQAADTVQAANFTNLYARLWPASRTNAAWMIQPDAFPQIADDQLANGQPLIQYRGDGTPMIFGLPVLQPEQMPALGDAGDVTLADLSQYLVAEKAPEFIDSIHVRFLHSESVFRFRWRVDGQPGWASAITPRNSTVTKSPFVTLAERA